MRRRRLLAVAAVLLFAFLLGDAHTPAHSAGDRSSPASTPGSTPESAVHSYFLTLNDHDWEEAWKYLHQHDDEPQIQWASFCWQWTSLVEHRSRTGKRSMRT